MQSSEPMPNSLDPARLPFRVGLGHDTHRLEPGGPLRLGGVEIPFGFHLHGHSDADVLLHAITDAVLGAAAVGDIGELFPDTDPANRGRDSADMLKIAVQHVRQAGWEIANVDSVVMAQQPKIMPHRDAMCRRIATILGVQTQQVHIKGKTGERVGPVGRQEAIVAECVVLLVATHAAEGPS